MGFPENSLVKGEELHLHLRPHWRVAFGPLALIGVYLVLVTVLWIMFGGSGWGRVFAGLLTVVGFIALIPLALWPIMVWRSTHIVVTSERIIQRDGVFHHKKRETQLRTLDRVGVDQTVLDRIFHSGDLVLDENGTHRLECLPQVVSVEVLINELIRARGHQKGVDAKVLEEMITKRAEERNRSL